MTLNVEETFTALCFWLVVVRAWGMLLLCIISFVVGNTFGEVTKMQVKTETERYTRIKTNTA